MPSAEGPFRYIGERERFHGVFFNVVAATFLDPGGFTFEREIVRHPGAVCVVPLEGSGEDASVLMIRQYRGALDRFVLELPAGKLDVPGEEPEAAARRELVEEIGRDAASMALLGQFHNSPGFTDERTFCYLAEGLSEIDHDRQGIEEEHITLERIPLASLDELVSTGELSDAKSLIALGFTSRLLARRERI